jgi:hypothetical protein
MIFPVIVMTNTDRWEIELPLAATVETVKQIIKELRFGVLEPIKLFCNGEYIVNDRPVIGTERSPREA